MRIKIETSGLKGKTLDDLFKWLIDCPFVINDLEVKNEDC